MPKNMIKMNETRYEFIPKEKLNILFDREDDCKYCHSVEQTGVTSKTWYTCPYCEKKLFKISSLSHATDITVYCKGCKREIDITF